MMVKDGILMVEGSDDKAITEALAKIYKIPETFHIKTTEGVDNLFKQFSLLLKAGRLDEVNFDIKRLGVVIDANDDISKRWKQIRNILTDKGYTVNENPYNEGTILRDDSKEIQVVGIWIMPDNIHSGILEDFFRTFIPENDTLYPYVSECIDHIEKTSSFENPKPRSKAETRTWLAWQKKSESRMGYYLSEKRDHLNIHNKSAENFIGWLQQLFNS